MKNIFHNRILILKCLQVKCKYFPVQNNENERWNMHFGFDDEQTSKWINQNIIFGWMQKLSQNCILSSRLSHDSLIEAFHVRYSYPEKSFEMNPRKYYFGLLAFFQNCILHQLSLKRLTTRLVFFAKMNLEKCIFVIRYWGLRPHFFKTLS